MNAIATHTRPKTSAKACEDRARWIDHEPEHAMTARECAAEIGRIQP